MFTRPKPGATRRSLVLLLGISIAIATSFAADSKGPAQETATPRYPDDAYSRPARDPWPAFETTCGILLGGNVPDRSAHWQTNELRSVEGGGARQTLWRFQRKHGATVAASLGFTENIRRAPESISFHVRNASGRAVAFHAVLYELSWNKAQEVSKEYLEWTSAKSSPVEPGAECEVVIPTQLLTAPQHATRATPWFPARLTIVADDVVDEAEYALTVSRLTLNYAAATGVLAASLEAPSVIHASVPIEFRIRANGIDPGRYD